jgi:hypothetical protein
MLGKLVTATSLPLPHHLQRPPVTRYSPASRSTLRLPHRINAGSAFAPAPAQGSLQACVVAQSAGMLAGWLRLWWVRCSESGTAACLPRSVQQVSELCRQGVVAPAGGQVQWLENPEINSPMVISSATISFRRLVGIIRRSGVIKSPLGVCSGDRVTGTNRRR